jgi:hypothetical protein
MLFRRIFARPTTTTRLATRKRNLRSNYVPQQSTLKAPWHRTNSRYDAGYHFSLKATSDGKLELTKRQLWAGARSGQEDGLGAVAGVLHP